MVKKTDEPSTYAGGGSPPRFRAAQVWLRPDLREAIDVVWLRKWSILAITLLTLGMALLLSSRQTPIYESWVKILVVPVADTGTANVTQPDLATDSELIASAAVAEIVAENVGYTGSPSDLLNNVSVDQPMDTAILEVGYRDPNPAQAQRMAAAFADAYLQYREETVTDAIRRSAEAIEAKITVLTQDLERINRQLEGMSGSDPRFGGLQTDANLLRTQILELQVERAGLPDKVTVGRIIQPAAVPSSPVSPNHVVNGAFGLVAGLALGIGLAFLRDRLSERVRSSEEAEAYLEAPVLAAIPRAPISWRKRNEAFLVTTLPWHSPVSEAYRVLRTNLMLAASTSGGKSIAVTSAYSGEGKSTIVANLGLVLAKAGKRVTLVSADFRRPRLNEFFRRSTDIGLIEVLSGRATLEQALQRITLPTARGIDASALGPRLLPSGRIPEDPTELLTSETLADTLKDLEDLSDIVLIDLPPVLPVTDALLVAALTNNVLLVIGPKGNTRPAIASARQQLDRVGARILGAVLNGSHASMAETYAY